MYDGPKSKLNPLPQSELDREGTSTSIGSFLKNVAMRIRTGGIPASARYGAYRLKNAFQLRFSGISPGLAEAGEIVSLNQLGLRPDCSRHEPTQLFRFAGFRTAMCRYVKLSRNDVFLDYGSGLGAAMLMAGTLPFRRIIGVEISKELNGRATDIINRYRQRLACKEFEFVTSEATQYDVPDDATVIYFFNPFRGDVMAGVFAKLDESLTRHPRALRVVFNHPIEAEKMSARFKWLCKCGDIKDPWSEEPWIDVYTCETTRLKSSPRS
jgi:hypothetical protein